MMDSDGQMYEAVKVACGASFRVFSYQPEQKKGELIGPRMLTEFASGNGMTAGIGFVTPSEARIMAKLLLSGAEFAEQQEATGAAS